jgi:hypothetical protein
LCRGGNEIFRSPAQNPLWVYALDVFKQVQRGDGLVTIFLGLLAVACVLTEFTANRQGERFPGALIVGGLFLGWLAYRNERIGRRRRRTHRVR